MDKLILLLLISTAFVVAQAKVVLPSYITDNMVVQRNSVMKITGHASSGSKVNVIAGWDSRSREVKADSEGKFDIAEKSIVLGAASTHPPILVSISS